MTVCPCGGASYVDCCGRYLDGRAQAPTALALMRSRYTAYTRSDNDYLARTWAAATRPADTVVTSDDGARWLGLEIRADATDGASATVEFVARYKIGGRAHRLHEISRFVRDGARWFYLDGSFPQSRSRP